MTKPPEIHVESPHWHRGTGICSRRLPLPPADVQTANHALATSLAGRGLLAARPGRPMTIDATYLANLVLAFIAVHEQAHIVHNHNSFEPAMGDPQIDTIAEAAMRHAAEDGDATAQDLRGSTLQLEQDADCFPLEVAPEDYRGALLEASSLWLAALAVADRGGHGWLEASWTRARPGASPVRNARLVHQRPLQLRSARR